MEEILKYLNKIMDDNPYRIIISGQKNKEEKYKKIVIEKKTDFFQVAKYTEKQVFHNNIDNVEDLKNYILNVLEGYSQANMFCDSFEYSIKISKKNKVLFNRNKNRINLKGNEEHNKKKNYLLEEGTVIEPLIDVGIFTKEGKVVQSMYDKFKQINRFIEIIDDAIKKTDITELTILDFGCGKSYLTFILYYYFTKVKGIHVKMIGLDLKEEVVEKCNDIAKKYGYNDLKFEVGDINNYICNFDIDMVITLHACDIATDFALYNAIKWNVKMIFSVPCCQHELNEQIKSDQFKILTKYGIVKERVAALFTDAIRSNLLEYCSYKTQMLEFVDLSHTPKNLLIRAVKGNISSQNKDKALQEVESLIKEFNLNPMLYDLLKKNNYIK